MSFIGDDDCGAVFSPCRKYRYTLWRRWETDCDLSRMVAFIGLNPSTADESENDPTVTRCINFAKSWQYGGMVMLNLFAFRGTDPQTMLAEAEPVGEQNDDAIRYVASRAGAVVTAWGNHGEHRLRGQIVATMLQYMFLDHVWHLGLNQTRHPKHPLYLRADSKRHDAFPKMASAR